MKNLNKIHQNEAQRQESATHETTEAIKVSQETLSNKLDEVKNSFPKEMKVSIEGAEIIAIKGEKGEKGDKGDIGGNGKDGRDGKNIKGDRGVKGDAGKDGRDGVNGMNGKDGRDGKDGSPDTGEQIIEKLNPIKNSLNFEVLTNIPDFALASDVIGYRGGSVGGGQQYRISLDGTYQAHVTSINFEGATYDGNGAVTVSASTGDVSKVGTPADNQIGVWTGDGTIEGTTGFLFSAGDFTIYDAVNDGNPVFAFGASATERLTITPTYDAGAQTLDFVEFATAVASGTADKGEYRFNVDGTLVATFDDGGLEIKASGSLSFGAVDILTDSAGTTTLNNIDALDATTIATFETEMETAIDTLSNLTSASSLATVGTIGTGVWQGTTIKANYLQQVAADLGDADITVDFTNSNAGNVTNLTIDGVYNSTSLTASEIVITDASKNLVSAAVATYPSLTELTYVKGVTSAIQTQLNGKANTALSNLASVAINTTLVSDTDNTDALGTSAIAWSDLYLGSGGVITFTSAPSTSDITITHSLNTLTFAGASYVFDGLLAVSRAGQSVRAINTTDNGSVQISTWEGARATPADNDEAYISLTLSGDDASPYEFGRITWVATDVNVGTGLDGRIDFAVMTAGSLADELSLTGVNLYPSTNDGLALGISGTAFSDIFLASGAVIDFAAGNAVVTHSSGILTVSTGDLRVTTAGTNTASAVTVGGTQTLTSKTLTSPTITTASLSGTQLLAESASIGLDPAGSADGAYSGITMTATAGYTQAFGDLVYLSSVDSRWEAADADAATTGDRMLAMVVVAGTDGNACTLLMMGTIRADAKFPALTIGSAVYVGEAAGEIQVAIPTGADNVIRRVGYALTADSIYFNPSMDSQISVA